MAVEAYRDALSIINSSNHIGPRLDMGIGLEIIAHAPILHQGFESFPDRCCFILPDSLNAHQGQA